MLRTAKAPTGAVVPAGVSVGRLEKALAQLISDGRHAVPKPRQFFRERRPTNPRANGPRGARTLRFSTRERERQFTTLWLRAVWGGWGRSLVPGQLLLTSRTGWDPPLAFCTPLGPESPPCERSVAPPMPQPSFLQWRWMPRGAASLSGGGCPLPPPWAFRGSLKRRRGRPWW